LLRRLNRTRIVATYHQPPDVLDDVADCARTARDLDAVIVLGSNQVSYFESILDRKRVFLIPYGIDTDYFAPANKARLDGRVCLFVGNWLRDFGMLKSVIDRVTAKDSGIQFRLVVQEERTSEFEGWKNTRLLHSLTDDELLKEYRSADLLVLPYVDVVASNTLLEGLSCGLPVITTDVGAIRDYLTPDCGYMVMPGDVTAMSQAVLTLVENGGRRQEMGKHGRRVALNHDWRRVAAAHLELYRSLAA
jgi:glycosyltransferase involved in cell wall biosynthesis